MPQSLPQGGSLMPHNRSPIDTEISAQAIDWLLQQRDPDFQNWDGFMAWLEISPDHNAAYEAAAMLDDELDALPRTAPSMAAALPTIAANDDELDAHRRPLQSSTARSRRWFGGALAAALIAAVTIPNIGFFTGSDTRRISTLAGMTETVTLPDGSRIDINGNSVLELDKSRPRFARLESGEAMFHIVHDEKAPFTVESGGAKIVDLGTAFNVIRTEDHTSVAVSEGLVVFNPGKDNVRMRAGQGVDAADDRKGRATRKKVDVAAVGGWRSGLLVYQEAPLSDVVADLHRTTGMEISVSVDAADLVFRGALSIDPDSKRTVEDLAALSGTRVLKQGRGWMLSR
jgi:transmembrane sensor